MNESTNEFAGIYLFDDEKSVQAYLEGELIAGLKQHPTLSDMSATQFSVVEEFSAATRAPI